MGPRSVQLRPRGVDSKDFRRFLGLRYPGIWEMTVRFLHLTSSVLPLIFTLLLGRESVGFTTKFLCSLHRLLFLAPHVMSLKGRDDLGHRAWPPPGALVWLALGEAHTEFLKMQSTDPNRKIRKRTPRISMCDSARHVQDSVTEVRICQAHFILVALYSFMVLQVCPSVAQLFVILP